jgi:GRAM domain-containing protein
LNSQQVERAKPEFIGGVLHRRVRLRSEEFVIKEAGSRFATLWGLALGRLFLTNQRILWCPLLLASLSRAKSIELSDVTEVGVLRDSTSFVPGSWYIRTRAKMLEIESVHDFWGGAKPEEWVAAVRSAIKALV